MVNKTINKNLLYRLGQNKNKIHQELKDFKKNVPVVVNNVIQKAIGDIYDDLGPDPKKKVLSTQDVHAILIDIELLIIKELE